jgi:hypothetical protein
MTIYFRTAILAAVIVAFSTTTAHEHFAVSDIICVEGYVMDQLCIDNQVMLDNGRATLEFPDDHSLHCLVDVGVCVNSNFEILTDPVDGSSMYGRGFAIDEVQDGGAGKDRILDVARTVGSQPGGCSTCYGDGPQIKGFRAVLNATVLEVAANKDSPTVIQLHTVFASNDQTSEVARATNFDDPCQELFGMERTVVSAAEESMEGTEEPEASGENGGDSAAEESMEEPGASSENGEDSSASNMASFGKVSLLLGAALFTAL